MDYRILAARKAIKKFPWDDYGLDAVGQAQSDEWAHALADAVVGAIVKADPLGRSRLSAILGDMTVTSDPETAEGQS